MRLSGGEAALARWLRAAATGDPVDVRVGPLPDPDGIERREGRGRRGEWGGNVRSWVLGFRDVGVDKGAVVGWPVGPCQVRPAWWGGRLGRLGRGPVGEAGVLSLFFFILFLFSFLLFLFYKI